MKDEAEQMLFQRWVHTDQSISFKEYRDKALGNSERKAFSEEDKQRLLRQTELIKAQLGR